MNFYKFLDSLRNIMRKDRGVTGDAQRIEQLSWIFFLKIFDDIENENVLILIDSFELLSAMKTFVGLRF